MQNLILVGNTGKYMTETTKEDGRTQYSFTVYVNNGKDKESTAYPCYLTGNKDKLKGIISNLFIPKETETNSKGKEVQTYHSRLVSINGNLSVYKEAQELPVSWSDEGDVEEVIALKIGVHVVNIEFHGARPDGAVKTGSKSDLSEDEKDKRRKELQNKKKRMLAQAAEDIEND